MASTTQSASRAQAYRSKEYETIYVLRGDIDSGGATKIQARVADVLDKESGKLIKLESWGRRKLAYPVNKQRRGVYMYMRYVGRGGLVSELERNLRLADEVMKFQTVLLDGNVEMSKLEIDPEEVKLGPVELEPFEGDDEESLERSLGLEDAGESRSRRGGGEDRQASAGAEAQAAGEGDESSAAGGAGEANAAEAATDSETADEGKE